MTGARLAASTALLLVGCLALIALSTPRRVGDGVEYWAMAEQLASFHLPSASRADILRLERDARRVGHGYETSPLRFAHLVAEDGRQDFPHFWLYPLVNVPALWLTRLVGVHPNWAFTLTNLVLLACAFVVVSRVVSMAWAALLLAGPVIWWSDKSHGDVFTLALLAMGCALWRRAPAWTLVLLALAAAQNPAIVPVWVLVATIACTRMRARDAPVAPNANASITPNAPIARQVIVGAIVGACIVAIPLAYYRTRLHMWTPLTGYTQPTWPSIRTMLSFVADPNLGLLPNVPLVGVAMLWIVVVAWRARRESSPIGWREWLTIAGVWGILLVGFSQSTNFNHGASPGINRWTLWLTPWPLLIVPARASMSAVVVMAALNTLWAVWFFRPSLPEVYRYPSATASWLWTHAPAWYSPAPEIFAERVSHREPALLPTAWEGCTKVLAIDGQWPVPCVPPANVPPECLGSNVLCYANTGTDTNTNTNTNETTFVALGAASFQWMSAPRRWPSTQPFVKGLREALQAALVRDRELAPRSTESVIRAMTGVGWANVWTGGSTIVVYLDTVSADGRLQVRVDADYHGALIDLDAARDGAPADDASADRTPSDRAAVAIDVPRSGERPSEIVIPAAVSHALLVLHAR